MSDSDGENTTPQLTVRRVRKLAIPPEPVEKRARSKVAGWEKGITRSACVYVQDAHHQVVNIAASALRTSKGVFVERAIAAYIEQCPDLEFLRSGLQTLLDQQWSEDTTEP